MTAVRKVTLSILILVVLLMGGCGVSQEKYDELEQKYDKLQQNRDDLVSRIETLQDELNQLKEQKKAEILQQAEAYNAIVKLCSARSSEPPSIQRITPEAIAESLKASGEFWNLITATGDPQLISLCQPNEWGRTCSCSQVRDYCEAMYKKLMAEYNRL